MKRALLLILLFIPLYLSSHALDGVASWYGGKYIGRQTANGEIFDTTEMTAAHKTLPFNTVVDVENLENGKKVRVRINDRGPFIEGRVIDLSNAAAQKIDMINNGTAKVKLHIVSKPEAINITDLQIGAFSNPDNALRRLKLLKENGFNAVSHLATGGIVRVFIEEVPIKEVYTTVQEEEG